ncbi:AAA family ATPase [Streptomyces sp. NPDC088141]|uniref:AAA family ATPase n=1 Tax=unclassified Streptomyces TaxID=2593676 RepID=UPI0034254B2F
MFHDAQLNEHYPLLSTLSEPLKKAERDIVGRSHETTQLLASMSRPELCNALLLAEAGTGKLLTLDTPIPTPSGWTTIGALQPGDFVLGRDGKPTRVSYVSDVDETPVLYDITLSDGQVITACADHQWLVASVSGRAGSYPTNVATTQARRDRVQARRDALIALANSDVPEFATAGELLELMGGVEDLTWTKPVGLQTYLSKHGVEWREATRTGEQAWKGRTRVTTVHVHEFNTQIALKALSEQVFRRTSWNASGELEELVLTTRQMVDAGVMCTGGKRRRFSIRVTEALDLPEADLSIDPYVLGAWLGDGSTGKGSFTQSDLLSNGESLSDMGHLIGQLRSAGYKAYRLKSDDQTVGTEGLQTQLRQLDVLGRKHIPLVYLRASIDQRLALLQGLMDTDGTIDEHGGCELTLSDEVLAKDAEELIRSLGIKVNRTENRSGYRDADGELVECKPRHRMVFTTTQQVFRLPRKSARLPHETRPTQDWLYITAIEPAPTQPGKCIQVDNEEHTYLCGSGFVPTHNTALVQATMLVDKDRLYLEVDPARMISEAGTAENMAAMLKGFFDEAERFVKDEKHELVLFIDEFHQIIQLSDAAVEAIKPVLAASGTRGIRIIAATTYEEFHKHISPNQPLVERLQRINLNPPDQATTIKILQGMAERYGVAEEFYDDHVFRQIYEYTQRYMPASAQPRKSILVLDSMVGWHRLTHRPMDRDLLSDVLMESLNVNVAFKVDGAKIKEQLDEKVFSQDWATGAVARRLQLSVADLNDKGRPMASMLFTGSTGVGKSEMTKQLARLLFGDDQRHLIRFDMTEYAEDSSFAAFRSELTKRVWDLSHAVLLFDEVEKASAMVTRVLLQVLDDGRLNDDNNREVSFLNTYIVLTTNAGSEIYKDIAQYAADDTGSGKQLMEYEKLIRRSISSTAGDNRFPPELLGRIDAIVPFQPLSLATQRKIVRKKLRQMVQEVFVKHNVRLDVDTRVLQYLIEDKGDIDSDAGGARAAVAKLTDEVTTAVATFLNEHPSERRIRIDVVGDLVSDDKNLLSSDAYVEVSAVR